MNEVIKDPNVEAAVIISSKPGSFIAGVDVAMLDAAKTEEEVNTVLIFSHSSLFFNTCLYIYFIFCFFLQLQEISRNGQSMIQKMEVYTCTQNYLIITSSLPLSLLPSPSLLPPFPLSPSPSPFPSPSLYYRTMINQL